MGQYDRGDHSDPEADYRHRQEPRPGAVTEQGQAEYDHFLPLELGGDPNSARNFWVEPPSPGHRSSQGVSNPKDGVETSLKSLVCHYVKLASHHQGSATSYLPLARAQALLVTNWTTAKALAQKYLVKG